MNATGSFWVSEWLQSETVWRQADEYKVPRMVYVNKMDTMGADFFRCIKMLHDRLHAHGVAIQLPIRSLASFTEL